MSNNGLNIAPPESPRHPEAQPPIKAVKHTDRTVFILNLMSLGIRPLPTLVFKACSFMILVIDQTDAAAQIIKNNANNSQSTTPQ